MPATAPTIMTTKRKKSVYIAPRNPPTAEYTIEATAVTATTVHCPTPNSVWPIFIAASITRPVVITLNTSPRYMARKPRRNAAALPE